VFSSLCEPRDWLANRVLVDQFTDVAKVAIAALRVLANHAIAVNGFLKWYTTLDALLSRALLAISLHSFR
jgi:hypothetical protein